LLNIKKIKMTKKIGHHLIFEGAELVGKSWLMAQVYDFLENKYNKNKVVLDGCHWFNSDVGIFGTNWGRPCITKYLEILEIMKEKNILFEKFHLSDIVYNRLHQKKELNYQRVEQKLKKLQTKIILCKISEDENIIKKRIADRLKLCPHYERILRNPKWYIKQQREYLKEIKKTNLPYLIINMTKIPNNNAEKVLKWIGEL